MEMFTYLHGTKTTKTMDCGRCRMNPDDCGRKIGVNPARQSLPELASAPFGTRMEDTFGLVQSDSMDLQNDPRFFQSNVLNKGTALTTQIWNVDIS